MTEKRNSLDLVNEINRYVVLHGLEVRDVIYACEIVKAAILEGIMENLNVKKKK